MKSTKNFACCVGLCCFTVLAASCHFPLPLGQENSTLSVASVEKKQVLQFSVKIVSCYEWVCRSISVTPRFYRLDREHLYVEREPSGINWVFESFLIWLQNGVFFTFSVTCTSSLSIGTPVSLETTNSLLDLLCFYGDGESTPEKEDKKEDLEEPGV